MKRTISSISKKYIYMRKREQWHNDFFLEKYGDLERV
jgi:hypothetical protein